MVKKLLFWIILVSLLLPGLWAPTAYAQDETPELRLVATGGFEGMYKADAWLPILVSVRNNGAPVEGTLQVRSGSGPGAELIFQVPVSLPTQSDKQITLYVYAPVFATALEVELIGENGRVLTNANTGPLRRLDVDTLLYGVVSSEPVELAFLEQVSGASRDAEVAFIQPHQLPDVAAILEAVDVLVLTNVDTGQLTTTQVTALEAWTASGGQLVVTGGVSGGQTLPGLAELLPVEVQGTASVADLPALQEAGGTAFRDAGPFLLTQNSLRNGEALIFEGDVPLLARRALGSGSVYFLALDPNVAPLRGWDGNAQLWAVVAATVSEPPVWAQGPRQGYSAANAVGSLPSLALPSAGLLLCFLGLYILILGPLNYLILKRLQRRSYAWVTIPAIILAFTAIAYVAGLLFRGDSATVNEMALVWGKAGAPSGKVTSLVALYSPGRATYDISLAPDVLVRPFDRNFGNLEGYGNLEAITRSSAVTLQDVRVDVSGIETFIAKVHRPLPDVTGQVILHLDRGEIEVRVQNNSEIELYDAGVLVGDSYVRLDHLAPGEVLEKTAPVSGTTGTVSSAVPFAPGPAYAPLSNHYMDIFGTVDYTRDEETYARWQLLESLADPAGMRLNAAPNPTATLIAWAAQSQLDIDLEGEDPERLATTAYFLDLDFSLMSAPSQLITIPATLFDWRVIGESGVYEADITNFYLPPGWIEYAFTPWPAFREMEVSSLDISLTSGDAGQPVPRLQLWDWEADAWSTFAGVTYGQLSISDFPPFIGPQNEVRVRLENQSTTGVMIQAVYPVISGTMQ